MNPITQALTAAQRAINSMKNEAETAAQGDEQMMLEACEEISKQGLAADTAIRAALDATDQAAPVGEPPTKLDANDLEAIAKQRPDDMFLKGSGVLKLTGAIRQLEAEIRTLRDTLEAARNGLQWYRDTYPNADSGADDEMVAQIEEALIVPASPVDDKRHPRFLAGYSAGLHDRKLEGLDQSKTCASVPDEVQQLRALAATCYAGLGAECNLPDPWLDALNAAANGEPFSKDGLLPFEACTSATKPLDDPRLQQAFGDAIEGALAFGFQCNNEPPAGHWLWRFWNIGRAEATKACASMGVDERARHLVSGLREFYLGFLSRDLTHKQLDSVRGDSTTAMAVKVLAERIAALASPAPSVGEPITYREIQDSTLPGRKLRIAPSVSTEITIPRIPTEAMLMAFYECPPEELQLAWEVMLQAAETMSHLATPPAAPAVTEGASDVLDAFEQDHLGFHLDHNAIQVWINKLREALAAPAAAVPEQIVSARTPAEARNMLNAFINARTAFMDRREGSDDAYQKAQQEIIQALVLASSAPTMGGASL